MVRPRKPDYLLTPEQRLGRLKRDKKHRAANIRRNAKPLPTPDRTLGTALSMLSDEWNAANAGVVNSPVAKLLQQASPPAYPVVEIEEPEEGNSQDALVSRHRVDIAKTRAIVMGLIAELDFLTKHEALFDLIADVCVVPDGMGVDKLREAYRKLIALPSRVALASQLGTTLKTLIPLERQAAGLADGYVDAATERAKKESTAVATVVATSFDAITSKFSQIMLKVQKNGP